MTDKEFKKLRHEKFNEHDSVEIGNTTVVIRSNITRSQLKAIKKELKAGNP